MEGDQQEFLRRLQHYMRDRVFMTPLFWDYPVWDDVMYRLMCADQVRVEAYRRAVAHTRGKVVVDIGTGALAPLSVMSVEAGAARVYAIEADRQACDQARALVQRRGLAERITVIQGRSQEVELPEPVDVCVSELIGCIGSSEGTVAILRDAQRFLKPGARMIPDRCVTWIAPVTQPESLCRDGFVCAYEERYLERFRRAMGSDGPFTRFEAFNFPVETVLAPSQVFEDIDFTGALETTTERSIRFPVQRAGRLDGFLLWINLHVDQANVVDTRHQFTSWGSVFMPCSGGDLLNGDVVELDARTQPSWNATNPDYLLRGAVCRNGAPVRSLELESRYHRQACQE